ncbi:MAG: hypothetical protein Q4G71_14155 [Pseudomonadota bacterium]|nr:hypothetical protein [Pseudomonadota bacterium]
MDRHYPYRPGWAAVILGMGFFALTAAVLGYAAASNARGLTIQRVVVLSPADATLLYGLLAACSTGFVLLAAFMAYQRMAGRQQRLVLGVDALTVPASRWSADERLIAYGDVLSLSESAASGQRLLHIHHRGGKHIIAAAMLPSRAAYEEICEWLVARVRDAGLAVVADQNGKPAPAAHAAHPSGHGTGQRG